MTATNTPIRLAMRSPFKAIIFVLLLFTTATLLSLREQDKPATAIRRELIRQCDELLNLLTDFQRIPLQRGSSNILHQKFRQIRLGYKEMEWATEYFDPLTTRQVNGPPVPEAELNGQIVQPDGLQVIEEDLYPQLNSAKRKNLTDLLGRLNNNILQFKETFQNAALQDWQILDAAKQEVFRIEILGLNDFDDPLLKNCFEESASALQSVQEVIRHYDDAADFSAAVKYLRNPVSFNHFDRAAFISRYANPVSTTIKQLHDRLKLPDVRYNRLLNQDAATLFDQNAYNRNAYTNAPGDSATRDKIMLGKKLFFDPVLSGNGKRSCSSCHRPDKAFTDGLVKNLDITGKRFIARNTTTLINAALQPAQFYDLRASSLEDQARDVMQNKDEMHGDMRIAIKKLWQSSDYRRLFSHAYPGKNRIAIDTFEVMNALGSYVRSLTALNSRFDKYMRGNKQAMNANETAGFNLFMGKAKCSTCHYLPLFNGALPPRYMQMEAEVIGVPKSAKSNTIDPDPGTSGIQPLGFNRHAFKTTTIRNAALTAPYMHNGAFKTLAEVIDFYNQAGGAGRGIRLPNQTLPVEKLHLTLKEKQQLIAFIHALNSDMSCNN